MKAINLNQKCAGCKNETDKCVKLADMQSDNTLCFDCNEFEIESRLVDELKEENKKKKAVLNASFWLFLILAVVSWIIYFVRYNE